MATKRQEDAINLYARLMQEIKLRTAATDYALMGRTGLLGPFVREFCFLQLRMMGELVVLGCLVAHGDIKATQTKTMQKEWSAEKILNRLGELHPDYYPHPVTHKRHRAPATPHDFLTKEELLILLGKAGSVLHRGSVKRLLSGKIPQQTHFANIDIWMRKLINLLEHHSIALLDGKTHFQCVMTMEGKGHPEVVILEPIEVQLPPS